MQTFSTISTPERNFFESPRLDRVHLTPRNPLEREIRGPETRRNATFRKFRRNTPPDPPQKPPVLGSKTPKSWYFSRKEILSRKVGQKPQKLEKPDERRLKASISFESHSVFVKFRSENPKNPPKTPPEPPKTPKTPPGPPENPHFGGRSNVSRPRPGDPRFWGCFWGGFWGVFDPKIDSRRIGTCERGGLAILCMTGHP